jgi:hypothetical protein
LYRANRAQFAGFSFRNIAEEDVERVDLPLMHGSGEDEGLFQGS